MKPRFAFSFLAAAILGGLVLPAFSPVLAQDAAASAAWSIVTVEPKGNNELTEPISPSAVKVKVKGKNAEVAGWRAYGANAAQPTLQLVLLIDDGARSSLGLHIQELQRFITSQPPTTEVAVAYMRNGTTTRQRRHCGCRSPLRAPTEAPTFH